MHGGGSARTSRTSNARDDAGFDEGKRECAVSQEGRRTRSTLSLNSIHIMCYFDYNYSFDN